MKKNNGLIVSFYLNDGVTDEQMQLDKNKFPYLSWSPYDRIGMREVEKFGDFFKSQFQESWNGIAQQIHLIPEYPEDISWEFNEGNAEAHSCLINSDKGEFGLNCIITVRFREAIVGKKRYREAIYQEIERIVDEEFRVDSEGLSIEWSGFISLGSEDAVFIVLANDIHSFARFINILKKSKISYIDGKKAPLIGSMSSFAGFNKNGWSGNPRANLHIRLILRPLAELEMNDKEFLEELKKELPGAVFKHLLLGNNIFDAKFNADGHLLNLFHDKKPFNGNSKFYQKYISSSRSYWEIIEDDNAETFEILVEDEKSKVLTGNGSKANYNKAEIEMLKTLMAQFILQEFQRMISFKESNAWKIFWKNNIQ